MKDTIKKIRIYDWDGTLFASPTPDIGKPIWLEKTGTEFPHKGWWSKKESIDSEVFDIKPIHEVSEAYKRLSTEEQSLSILMTGRIAKLKELVIGICDKHGFIFDRHLFNYQHDTLKFKLDEMTNLFIEHPDLEVFEMFEDREEHITYFEKWGEAMERIKRAQGKPFKFIMHHIISTNHS